MAFVRLDPQCICCLLKKHLNAAPETAPEAQRVAYMQRMLRLIADASPYDGAPVLVSEIEALQREMFGIVRDFSREKSAFNQLMLSLEAGVWQRIAGAEDPLYAAVQFAMIGNYIDFGAMDQVDEKTLGALMEESSRFVPEKDAYEALRKDVMRAKKAVYLTDNCGEIVMDKLLLRQIHLLNPVCDLTVVTRGAPVLNDATMDDALACGLDEYAHVMHNGSGIAGTCLEKISDQAHAAIDEADVIIAKGQANFETLRRCEKNVYYIFLCKCELYAKRFGVPKLQGMLVRDEQS
ncbi:MAG: DUF89 family protein [Clostridia bacterium]|nr:DUF89 family protein [Clostridia bacterium]